VCCSTCAQGALNALIIRFRKLTCVSLCLMFLTSWLVIIVQQVLGATPAHATSMVGVMGAGADAVAFGGPSGLNPNWLASRACALLPVSKNDEDLNSLSSPKLHHSSSSSSSSPGNSSSSSSSTSRGHSLHRRGATRASSTGGNLASRAATESVVEASASPNSPSSSSSSSSLKPFRVNGGRAASLDAVQVLN